MSVEDAFSRAWDNIIGRADGPLNLRLFIQPALASFFAIRAGLRDARNSKPPFLWTVFTNPQARYELLHEGWKDIGKAFIIALTVDAIYQIIAHSGIYFLEMLVVAVCLSLVPYIILRGPVNRIARKWITKEGK